MKKKKEREKVYFSKYGPCGISYNSYVSEDHDERCKDDYCRCSTLEDIEILSINIEEVVKCFVDHLKIDKKDEITIYCIDRILRHHKVYDVENWNVEAVGGYYGEELGDPYLNDKLETAILLDISNMLNCGDSKVEYVLSLEYHNVLPQLQGKSWSIAKVDWDDVIVGNGSYMQKIPEEDIYEGYKGIIAVCSKEGNKYRLWDGYHRFCKSSKGKIKILVGE